MSWWRRLRSGRSPAASRLKAQHHLGDDVALDLVGAAVDRGLAAVEVDAGDAADLVGDNRSQVVRRIAQIGRAVVAGRLERQPAEALLDLGPLDLQDR